MTAWPTFTDDDRRKADKHGILIFMVVFVVVVSLMAGAYRARTSGPAMDEATLCPPAGMIPGHIVVLVDQTDLLTQPQVDQIRARIEDIRDAAAEHTRISVGLIGERVPTPPRMTLSLCKPRQGKDASAMTEDPNGVQERFDKDFGEPLRCAIQAATDLRKAPASPLIEYVEAVSGWSRFREIEKRRIVLITDFLQNSERLPHYSSSTGSLSNLPPLDLRGVEIQMVHLLRSGQEVRQTEAHRQEWRRFFKRSGAILTATPDSILGWAAAASETIAAASPADRCAGP